MKIFRYFLLAVSLLFSAFALAAPVDINNADAASLAEAINGVGTVKARAIVEYRDQHGPFASVDDLLKVRGIGEKTLEKNRHNLSVGGSAAQAAATATEPAPANSPGK